MGSASTNPVRHPGRNDRREEFAAEGKGVRGGATVEDLQGTWKLVAYRTSEGMVGPSSMGREPAHLIVDDDRIAGTMGVNRLIGGVGDDGLPGTLATTMMAGPPALMEQETTVLKHLQEADSVTVEGTRLTFWHEGSALVELELSPADGEE